MAKLGALPSKATIDGFRGVLDFYTWCELNIVRKWPKWTKEARTQAVIDAQVPFTYINKLASTLTEPVVEPYVTEASGTGLTWKDFVNRDYINGRTNFSSYQTEGPPADEYGEDMILVILDSEVQKVFHNNIAASVGWTDIDVAPQVTADTTHAIMRIKLQCNSGAAVNDYGMTMRQKGGAQGIDCVHWWAGVTTAFTQINDIIVPLDEAKKLQYKIDIPAGGGNVFAWIWIIGHYEQV